MLRTKIMACLNFLIFLYGFCGILPMALATTDHAMDELLVEENQEARAMQERKESVTARMILTQKEMAELGGQTAADVLRRLPRLYFSGPPTTNKDVRMAGLDKEFQNILINGNRPPGGGEKREFALDRIPVEAVERIEILTNATAAHDSDAVAGIVNIVLKEADRKKRFSVHGSASWNDMAERVGPRVGLDYSDVLGPLAYRAGATYDDNYRGKEKDVRDLTKKQRETEDETVRTQTQALDLGFSGKAGGGQLSYSPFFTRSVEEKNKKKNTLGLEDASLKERNLEKEDKTQTLHNHTLEWKKRFSGGANLKLQMVYADNEEDKDKWVNQYKGTAATPEKKTLEKEIKNDRDLVLAADYRLPVTGLGIQGHIFGMGFKVKDKDRTVKKTVMETNSKGVTKDATDPLASYGVEERISSLYLMDEMEFSDRLILTPGLRMEYTDGSYRIRNGVSASDTFTDWNPSLHARYMLSENWLLRASLARTISRPTFKDKVPTRSEKKDKVEEGNPDLKAATSMNYEAGMERYFQDAGIVSLWGFYKDVDDIIEKQEIGTDALTDLPIVRPINAGEATIKGLTFEARTDLSWMSQPSWVLSFNYTLQTSEVKDPNTGEKRKLKDQPESMGNLIVRFQPKTSGFSASLGLNYIGEKVNEEAGKEKKTEDPFYQWDLSLAQNIGKSLQIHASCVNLLDESRKKKEGGKTETESVGRTFVAGMKYVF